MEDTLIIQRGEALRATIEYANEDGTPMNLTEHLLSCPDASEVELKDAVELTYIDQAKGVAEIVVPAEIMNLLPAGRSSWLRIAITQDEEDASPVISQKMWIDIQ